MTIAELIEQLQKVDDKSIEVWISYPGGANTIGDECVEARFVSTDTHERRFSIDAPEKLSKPRLVIS